MLFILDIITPSFNLKQGEEMTADNILLLIASILIIFFFIRSMVKNHYADKAEKNKHAAYALRPDRA